MQKKFSCIINYIINFICIIVLYNFSTWKVLWKFFLIVYFKTKCIKQNYIHVTWKILFKFRENNQCLKEELQRREGLKMRTGSSMMTGKIYFFINMKDKAICLICCDSLSTWKPFNLKRHYEQKHSEIKELTGGERKAKLELLKANLTT